MCPSRSRPLARPLALRWRLTAHSADERLSGFSLARAHCAFRVRLVATVAQLCDIFLMAVTVVIVDDHPSFRTSARTLLELEGFQVVGEAEDGASALEIAAALEPELVLLDVALPDTNGFEVAERLAGGPSKVILTSSREQRDLGRRVRSSGALGFVRKDRLTGQALTALLEDGR
jgi:CheY-like chemotaxis protein